jgi:hypothetical protein
VDGYGSCSNGNTNPCKDTFGLQQRAFAASPERSGMVQALQVLEASGAGANSLATCPACHDLVVNVGIQNLAAAAATTDPPVTLRFGSGNQNGALDCDPSKAQFVDELAYGCSPDYAVNTSDPCEYTNATELWATEQPWQCVAVETGDRQNQIAKGLNLRILGAEKPSACTAPNNWAEFPDLPKDDPRIVHLFLVPPNSFDGTGQDTKPVQEFAAFYITGWEGQGSGFDNPCSASKGGTDDPIPGNEAGTVVGHFITYISSYNDGGAGEELCDLGSLQSCIPVLTE